MELLKFRNDAMPLIRILLHNHPADRIEEIKHSLAQLLAVVPSATVPVAGRCHCLRVNLIPDSILASESRQSTFLTHASTGEEYDVYAILLKDSHDCRFLMSSIVFLVS
jgi:hypothetical protein